MSTLVAYFSVEGTTEKIAQQFADRIRAEVFEIKPRKPYSELDILWVNPLARVNQERFFKRDVPAIGRVPGFRMYDCVYLGFPIWFESVPRAVITFCKRYDWTGKVVHIFVTSDTTGVGGIKTELKPYLNGAAYVDAKLVKDVSEVGSLSLYG